MINVLCFVDFLKLYTISISPMVDKRGGVSQTFIVTYLNTSAPIRKLNLDPKLYFQEKYRTRYLNLVLRRVCPRIYIVHFDHFPPLFLDSFFSPI